MNVAPWVTDHPIFKWAEYRKLKFTEMNVNNTYFWLYKSATQWHHQTVAIFLFLFVVQFVAESVFVLAVCFGSSFLTCILDAFLCKFTDIMGSIFLLLFKWWIVIRCWWHWLCVCGFANQHKKLLISILVYFKTTNSIVTEKPKVETKNRHSKLLIVLIINLI